MLLYLRAVPYKIFAEKPARVNCICRSRVALRFIFIIAQSLSFSSICFACNLVIVLSKTYNSADCERSASIPEK